MGGFEKAGYSSNVTNNRWKASDALGLAPAPHIFFSVRHFLKHKLHNQVYSTVPARLEICVYRSGVRKCRRASLQFIT